MDGCSCANSTPNGQSQLRCEHAMLPCECNGAMHWVAGFSCLCDRGLATLTVLANGELLRSPEGMWPLHVCTPTCGTCSTNTSIGQVHVGLIYSRQSGRVVRKHKGETTCKLLIHLRMQHTQ